MRLACPAVTERGDDNRLVWIDLEMTGLDTQRDSIIEIATVVTDKDLVVIAEGPVLALEPNPYVFKVLARNATLNPGKTAILPLNFAATSDTGPT